MVSSPLNQKWRVIIYGESSLESNCEVIRARALWAFLVLLFLSITITFSLGLKISPQKRRTLCWCTTLILLALWSSYVAAVQELTSMVFPTI